MKIGILGASGYVGRAIFRAANSKYKSVLGLRRSELRYYETGELREWLRRNNVDFLINAAGYTGKPNVDACENNKLECLRGNAELPGIVREECRSVGIPFGHVSSGCIFTGQKADGSGFRESDEPNFSFRQDNCSFYSGSKALGEEMLLGCQNSYIWRLRIPFSNIDGPRNYISKVLAYSRLLDARNSFSNLEEFANSCLKCIELEVPYGTYNLTNEGSLTTREVCELIREHLFPNRNFAFFENEKEFLRLAAKTPRSNCVLDTTKAQSLGVGLRPVREAFVQSLRNWVRLN